MLLIIVLSHVYRKEQLINKIHLTFPGLFSETIKKNGNQNALAFAGEQAMTYHQLSRRIDSMIAMLEQMGVKPGDKVAILSVNMPNWAITYFGITFMGAVAVPILPDFSVRESRNILEHSGAKALFVSEKLSGNISDLQSKNCRHIIQMDDFTIISGDDKLLFDSDKKPQKKYRVQEDDLASIIYTSGTTGQSKGVMLSHKNICSNAIAGGKVQPIDSRDRFLSVLPLSHTYENTLGLILPMIFGASVHYLREKPVAAVMIPAMKAVRPTMMLTVPLIIERIYRSKIKQALTVSFVMKLLYAVPLMRRQMQLKAGKKLMKTFGGELKFFGIGGARLDREVEQFLIGAKFPYAIGYGLTESSPLLAGLGPAQCRLQSTGPSVDGVEIRINDP
ncbi:MAG: AMP-binding protein, partial [Bacteroidales bacterium]|nr:AMP-binding protein [Bacteroidales bacterium]